MTITEAARWEAECWYSWEEIRVYHRGDNDGLAVNWDSGNGGDDYESGFDAEMLCWVFDAESFYREVASVLAASSYFDAAEKAEINSEARKIWKETRSA